MNYDYVFYTTDESFDYPTGYGYATHYVEGKHGFSLSIDIDNYIDFSSFDAFGDFGEMEDKCKNLKELKAYILNSFDEIQESDEYITYSNREIFEELIEIIDINLNPLNKIKFFINKLKKNILNLLKRKEKKLCP